MNLPEVFFSAQLGCYILFELSPVETVSTKCLILFSLALFVTVNFIWNRIKAIDSKREKNVWKKYLNYINKSV